VGADPLQHVAQVRLARNGTQSLFSGQSENALSSTSCVPRSAPAASPVPRPPSPFRARAT
jgi:hypothetical protein